MPQGTLKQNGATLRKETKGDKKLGSFPRTNIDHWILHSPPSGSETVKSLWMIRVGMIPLLGKVSQSLA